jgi:hypothetical protein
MPGERHCDDLDDDPGSCLPGRVDDSALLVRNVSHRIMRRPISECVSERAHPLRS